MHRAVTEAAYGMCSFSSYDHVLQLKVVKRTLNYEKCRDKILESNVRPSGTRQNARTWCSKMTKQDLTVLASSRNTKTYRTLLVFYSRACLRTRTISNTSGTNSADVFETWNQQYQTFMNFARLYWRSGTGCHVLNALN